MPTQVKTILPQIDSRRTRDHATSLLPYLPPTARRVNQLTCVVFGEADRSLIPIPARFASSHVKDSSRPFALATAIGKLTSASNSGAKPPKSILGDARCPKTFFFRQLYMLNSNKINLQDQLFEKVASYTTYFIYATVVRQTREAFS